MQTVTLETAKALKDAGYPQESHWVWCEYDKPQNGNCADYGKKEVITMALSVAYAYHHAWPIHAAPTAGELLEWFKEQVHIPCLTWWYGEWVADHRLSEEEENVYIETKHPDNPAEALGLLAIKVLTGE